MAAPNPNTLHQAAKDLRDQVTWIEGALTTYRSASAPERLIWEGPGRHHLDAYHKPSLDRLEDMRRHLTTAADRLDQAGRDLARRIRQLRADEQDVRAALPRYFEKLNYIPHQIAEYRAGLPPSEDPAWADYARIVVGYSATGQRR